MRILLAALGLLSLMHGTAQAAKRIVENALDTCLEAGQLPSDEERAMFCYPLLLVCYRDALRAFQT
jgi:hypothetical protein